MYLNSTQLYNRMIASGKCNIIDQLKISIIKKKERNEITCEVNADQNIKK